MASLTGLQIRGVERARQTLESQNVYVHHPSKLVHKEDSRNLRISNKAFSYWKEQWRVAGTERKAAAFGGGGSRSNEEPVHSAF